MADTVHHLSIQGSVFELPLEDVVTWSLSTLVSPFELLGALHWAQYFAMPGRARGKFLHLLDETILQLRTNVTIVDEPEISRAIKLTLPCLEAFVAAARNIEDWQEMNVPKKVRTAHKRAVRERGPLIPPWHDSQEFRSELDRSSSALSAYLDALSVSIEIIKVLCPKSRQEAVFEQLDRAQQRIPDTRLILRVGYEEAIRRKFSSMDLFSA
jgi:hypothetical protein